METMQYVVNMFPQSVLLTVQTRRSDLQGRLPVVYNGKSVEEWHSLHVQLLMKTAREKSNKNHPVVAGVMEDNCESVTT